jgi:HEPN domain-containing protein
MYEPHARATSTAFLEAYRRCMEDRATQGKQEAMFIPALVCAAFSAEVGLKALLLQEGKAAKGHDLYELFAQLTDEHKQEIVRLVAQPIDQFQSNLRRVKDAFPEWRYFYEFNDERSISVEFVARLANAIVKAHPLNAAST